MRESTVVAEWKAEGRAEGITEGIAKGVAQGVAQGRAEGIAEAKRSDLLLVLGHRFNAPVPADLVAAVEAQPDVDVLSRWLTAAITAGSVEAFRSAITP